MNGPLSGLVKEPVEIENKTPLRMRRRAEDCSRILWASEIKLLSTPWNFNVFIVQVPQLPAKFWDVL